MKLSVGDLVVLSDRFGYVPNVKNIDERPGLIVDLVPEDHTAGVNPALGTHSHAADVLWPDGRVTRVHTIYLVNIHWR